MFAVLLFVLPPSCSPRLTFAFVASSCPDDARALDAEGLELRRLLGVMGARPRGRADRAVSEEEWGVIGFYRVLIFEALVPPLAKHA